MESPVELIMKFEDISDANDFMNDKTLEEAFAYILKIMVNPDVPQARMAALLARLQAYSGYCALQATIYSTIKKGPAGSANNHKKNIYYTAADTLDKIVQALKYTFKIPGS